MPVESLTQNVEYKAIPGQVNIDEAQGIVECFVAGIGNKDSVGDICATGCFNASLKRRKPRVVWGHNWNEPIGKVLEIYEVPANDPRLPAKMKAARIGGLYARVQFNLKSERGRQAFADVSFFGEEQEWSIGYKTLNADYDSQRQANILREVELYEVSPVLHGANQLTGTISIKSDSPYSDEFTEKADEPLKDPKGGLTAAGRAHFNRTEGSNLKPGVKGPADTPQKMRRKGSFLTRFFTNLSGPLKDENGEPTRLALSAAAWGEPVPQNAEDAAELAAKGRRLLERYDKLKKKGYGDDEEVDDDDDYTGPRGEDGGVPAANPALGRMGNLARALATRFGGAVRLREADLNQVIFDHMSKEGEKHTLRVSYHYDGDEYMFGNPVKVKPQMVFIAETDDSAEREKPRPQVNNEQMNPYEDQYDMDENPMIPQGVKPKMCDCGCMGKAEETDENAETSVKAPTPVDAIPQERFTGDVLRGYGPRRGNLERLLRYWRPIMRKPGGFRRCRVILADHPELYPLNNICAWLHHETTGLWPNEGCHHPGMKNCRKKIRGVANGSIWDNNEWDARMGKLRDRAGKGLEMEDDLDGMSPEEWEKSAAMELKTFLDQEPELVAYIGKEENWEHYGEDDKGMDVIHALMSDDDKKDCGCGCGGAGTCAPNPMAMVTSVMSELGKALTQEMETKAGRVISNRNMEKLNQALALLQQVVESSVKPEMQMKSDGQIRIKASVDSLYDVKQLIDPVLNYHGIDSRVDENGIYLGKISSEAQTAMIEVLSHFNTPNV